MQVNLKQIISRFTKGKQELSVGRKPKNDVDSIQEISNWYNDMYRTVLMQRNFLIFFTIGSLIGILFLVYTVKIVTESKTVEPFVIEIEEETGRPSIVMPSTLKEFSADIMLKRYFIMQYIKAREEYDSYTYNHNYHTIVRLLSASNIYNEFAKTVSETNRSGPIKRYGTHSRRKLKLRADMRFQGPNRAEISVITNETGKFREQINKLITIEFRYVTMNLNLQDWEINPIGFQVTSYSVKDEFK